jgi:hypothetical protein
VQAPTQTDGREGLGELLYRTSVVFQAPALQACCRRCGMMYKKTIAFYKLYPH